MHMILVCDSGQPPFLVLAAFALSEKVWNANTKGVALPDSHKILSIIDPFGHPPSSAIHENIERRKAHQT